MKEKREPYDLRRINGKIVNILDKPDEIKKTHNHHGRGLCLDCIHRVRHSMGNGTMSQCRHPKVGFAYQDPHNELSYHQSPAKVRWAMFEVGVKVDNPTFETENNAFVFPFVYNHFKILDCRGFEE